MKYERNSHPYRYVDCVEGFIIDVFESIIAVTFKKIVGIDMKRFRIYILLASLLVILTSGCIENGVTEGLERDGVPDVVIIGNGVGVDTESEANDQTDCKLINRVGNLNKAHGLAMWEGALAAYNNSEYATNTDKYELYSIDDCGVRKRAEQKARIIQSSPEVIGVIGHATSGTTRSAAYLYDRAGIPLIMPIATSPFAVYPPGQRSEEDRLSNFVRLPPDDRKAQAPAASIVATEMLGGEDIYLLADKSADAWEYSRPLFTQIDELIPATQGVRSDTVRDSPEKLKAAADDIALKQPDVLVFAGYGTTAEKLLNDLNQKYREVGLGSQKPRVVMTDGTMTGDISSRTMSAYDIYITFPIQQVRKEKCRASDYDILKATIGDTFNRSFQVFGYDAVLMVDSAIGKCAGDGISRSCVMQELQQQDVFRGACTSYSFKEGENILSQYYVYSNVRKDSSRSSSLKMIDEISANRLADYYALHK